MRAFADEEPEAAEIRIATVDLVERHDRDYGNLRVFAYEIVDPINLEPEEVSQVWESVERFLAYRAVDFGLDLVGAGSSAAEITTARRREGELRRQQLNLDAQMRAAQLARDQWERQIHAEFLTPYHDHGLREFIGLSKDRAEADKKAEALLLRHLSEPQAEDYKGRGFFEVRGQISEALYRIRKGRSINVTVTFAEAKPPEARPGSHRLCLTLPDAPVADQLLMQKLMIEGDEREFLRKANWWGAGGMVWNWEGEWYQAIQAATRSPELRWAFPFAGPRASSQLLPDAAAQPRGGVFGNILAALGLV